MGQRDENRLIAKVARLYHEAGLKQPEIATRLGLHQVKVSRLLREAIERDIVRITVRPPLGVHAELETAIEERFDVQDAIVVDTTDDVEGPESPALLRELGEAAAFHLERSLRPGDVIGISSWSASLLATVEAMRPAKVGSGVKVVQLLGGVGDPSAEVHATELTRRLAAVVKGEAMLLPVPGVVGTARARKVLEGDAHVRRVVELYPKVTVALVGIGTVEPSPLLARSGNVFSESELEAVRAAGGVGDVCLRFFDRRGRTLSNRLEERVIGMRLDQLREVPRSIAVAGGVRKAEAIAAALRGGLVSTLVTDKATASILAADVGAGRISREASPAVRA